MNTYDGGKKPRPQMYEQIAVYQGVQAEKDDSKHGENEGIKHDKNKIRWDLLPFEVLHDVVRVLEFGEKTYGKNNWQNIENAHERLWNAAMRHLIAAKDDIGEIDNETDLPHLAHCVVNLLFLMWYSRK